jgi:hypothetical protein
MTAPDWACLGPLIFSQSISQMLEDRTYLMLPLGQLCDLFRAGDWGDLCEEDWQANIDTVSGKPGGRLMGAYRLPDRQRVWIITAGYGNQDLGPDYCYTTVLFPDEY